MLVLLFGPSGVGKTTIIRSLVADFKWSPVISVVTRAPRADDDFKIHVSHTDFECLAAHMKLWSDVSQFGERYGTLKAEVRCAIEDEGTFYVLDFSIARRSDFFEGFRHLPIVILPETEYALEKQLERSGRTERIAAARDDLQVFQEMHHISKFTREVRFIVNKPDNIHDTVSAIDLCAKSWAVRHK